MFGLGIAKLFRINFRKPLQLISSHHLSGIVCPEAKNIYPSMEIGYDSDAVATRSEDVVNLVVCGKETLCLSGRLEPAHDFLPSSRRRVTAFSLVVETFVVMGSRRDVATQLVCDDNPWLAKLRDQLCHETLGSFRISARLDKNIERITVGVDSTPEPMRHAVDRNHNLVEVPFVVRPRPVTAYARGEMRSKPIDPAAYCFSADHHATFGKQIFNIRRTQRKTMVRPDRVGNDFTGVAKALQTRH